MDVEHSIDIRNREDCKITGINEIISFSEKEIVVGFSDNSLLMIRGKKIQIISYSGDSIYIAGKLNSFTYSN